MRAKETNRNIDWVSRARTEPVTDIGQIPENQVRRLRALVKKGVLRTGVDRVFPKSKTYYVGVEYTGATPEDDPRAGSVPDFDVFCADCKGPAVIFPASKTAPNGWCFCPKCSTRAVSGKS